MTKLLRLDDPVGVVYWLYDESCSCPEESGYIGCCANLAQRLANHRRAFASYKGAIGTPHPKLEVKILLIGTLADCLALERNLRPSTNIGWNRNRGGRRTGPNDLAHPYIRVLEPKTRKGVPHSDATREKMRQIQLQRFANPAERTRLSEAAKKDWKERKASHKGGPMHHVGKGIPKSPEHREKMRQAALRRYSNSEEREKTAIAVKNKFKNGDTRRKKN